MSNRTVFKQSAKSASESRLENRLGSEWPVTFEGDNGSPKEYIELDCFAWIGRHLVFVFDQNERPVRLEVNAIWGMLQIEKTPGQFINDLYLESVKIVGASVSPTEYSKTELREAITTAFTDIPEIAIQLIGSVPTEYRDNFCCGECEVSFAMSSEVI